LSPLPANDRIREVDDTVAEAAAGLSALSTAPTERYAKSPSLESSRQLSARGRKSVSEGDRDGHYDVDEETAMEVDKPELSRERSSPPVVDAEGDVDMEIAPPVEELPTPEFTLLTGQSIGVQIVAAKAADLAPDTTVVDVPGPDNVTATQWRPNDPLTLAASGDTFCGLWKLSGQRSSVSPAFEKVVEDSYVTAVDWDPTGQMLAVAVYRNHYGTVTTYNTDGTVAFSLPDTPVLVSALRWADRGPYMAIVLSDGQQSSFTLWDNDLTPETYSVPEAVDGPIYDITWTDNGNIYACGDGSVYQCMVDDNIYVSRRWTSEDPGEAWTVVKTASWRGSPVAAVASSSTPDIWIPTHDIMVRSAHHAEITTLEFHPRSSSAAQPEKGAPLRLATSSMDDTVKLWHVNPDTKDVHCVHRLFLGPSCPALVSKFSPDGYAIAAASQSKLFIWHAERGGTPLATWEVPADDNVKDEANLNRSPRSDRSDGMVLDRTLSWDSDGKKLAFGFGQKVY
jgi:WD40 repeat protein